MSFIPRLATVGDSVMLMPFSGIQYFDAGLDAEKHRSFRCEFWEEHDTCGGELIARLKRVTFDPDGNSSDYVIVGEEARTVPADEVYSVRCADALQTFSQAWVPVPIFRIQMQQPGRPTLFSNGPTTWARMRVVPLEQPDERGNTHRLVFAIDTTLARRDTQVGDGDYLSPLDVDSEEQKSFALVDHPGRIADFANLTFVTDWLLETFEAARTAKLIAMGRDPNRRDVGDRPRECEHWAHYLTLLDVIHRAVVLPKFTMSGALSPLNREPAVKVDLVLDIGNSRTCGILIERHPGDQHPALTDSYPLELRDLSRPERVYAEAFDSRIEFAKADFGNEQIASRSGRNDAFVWYSMVRTGREAVDLCISARGGEGATGLSSPKRYLWDEVRQPSLWKFNMSFHRNAAEGPIAVHGPAMAYLTEDGKVISALPTRERQLASEAFDPHFSRCSLFTLMLHEVLLHAVAQINSIANRARRRNTNSQRVLDKIVLTLPPGMPLPERRKFQERAQAAIHLLWDCFSVYDSPLFSAATRPRLVEPYDEASSTQIVYLYAEVQRLQNGLPDLITAYGRRREVSETIEGRTETRRADTLRIASIDIGGGTTDLMVITHEIQNRGHIIPHQNFRESVRLAGDDILREVIRHSVIPAIEAHAKAKGVVDPRELTSRVFGADQANMTEPERQRRRQLAIEVIVPVALALLRGCEEERAFAPSTVEQKSIAQFFDEASRPSLHVLDHIDSTARRLGATEFQLLETPIRVDIPAIQLMIGGFLEPILATLGEVIHDLDCDLVLISGRPSRLPIVRDLLLSQLAVTPDRLVSMSGYRVGNWYPFRNHLGEISDPKTTTAVGAALTWLALGELGGIRFEAANLRHRSTARFIGVMQQSRNRLLDSDVILGDVDLDQPSTSAARAATAAAQGPRPFPMPYRLILGYRQLPLERWPAMPLYELTFKGDFNAPCVVTIARSVRVPGLKPDEPEGAAEDFEPVDVQLQRPDTHRGRFPGPRDIDMRLQTLPSRDGYWLDTGVIKD